MCKDVRDTLNRLPSVTAQCLGGDRICAAIQMSTGHFDAEQLQQHPLIKRPDVPKEPGVRSTVCLNECAGVITLTSHYPNDLAAVIQAAYKKPVSIDA